MNGNQIARLAERSLIAELETTPKPGLVDKRNSGAHKDMNFLVMSKGISAVAPFFADFYAAGKSGAASGAFAEDTVSDLKTIGRAAERSMLAATGGVNTHKGAVYCFGNVLGALGLLDGAGIKSNAENLSFTLSKTGAAAKKELESIRTKSSGLLTAGERLYLESGEAGARGQAAAGYRFVLNECLPLAKKLLRDMDANSARVKLLAFIMSNVTDSNVYKRGGFEAAMYVKRAGKELFSGFSLEKAAWLDDEFIKRNLSPGGAADTLALTLFLIEIFKSSSF